MTKLHSIWRMILLLMSIAGCLLIGGNHAQAVTSVTVSGIKVSPAIVNLELTNGQTSTNFHVNITNNTKSTVTLSISSVDFKSLNDTGGVAFIGNSSNQLTNQHSLAPWIDTNLPPVTLTPGQTKTIQIIINNRSDLGPGGHYAAILYTAANVANTTGVTRVNVNEVASTLVFVSKTDGAQYSIQLQKPVIKTSWWRLPTNINLYFNNTGNIQTVPRGLVTITSPLSKEVSRGQINTDSSMVLPEGTRLYRTSLFHTGSAWIPGIYHVRISYHPDGSTNTKQLTTTFLYLNLASIFEILAGIILVWIGFDLIFHKQGAMRRLLSRKPSKYRLGK